MVLSDNERKIYPISDRVEFCLIQVARAEPTPKLPCVFLVGKLEDGGWRSLELPRLVDLVRRLPRGAVRLERDLLAALSPDALLPPVLNHPLDGELLGLVFGRFPRFGEPGSGWRAVFGREIDSSGDREHFTARSELEKRRAERIGPTEFGLNGHRFVPLLEGRNIWQLRYGFTDPKLWIEVGDAERLLPPNPDLNGLRSNATIRVAWRDVSRFICERSMVAAVLPAGTASKHKLPYVRAGSLPPAHMVLLAALWTSFAFDWQLRTQGINAMTFGPLRDQPVPSPHQLEHVLPLALAAIEPDWLRAEAAAACETAPTLMEWWLARARLDAAIFDITGMSLNHVGYVLSTFPMLDRQQPPLPGERHSTITRDLVLAEAAAHLGGPDPELGELFARIGRGLLGGPGHARERVDRALALGAVPYIAEPQADQSRDWAEDDEEDPEE
jgi:hypothetical protein